MANSVSVKPFQKHSCSCVTSIYNNSSSAFCIRWVSQSFVPHPLCCRGRDKRQAQMAARWGSPGHPGLLRRLQHSHHTESQGHGDPGVPPSSPWPLECAWAWPRGGENPEPVRSIYPTLDLSGSSSWPRFPSVGGGGRAGGLSRVGGS